MVTSTFQGDDVVSSRGEGVELSGPSQQSPAGFHLNECFPGRPVGGEFSDI